MNPNSAIDAIAASSNLDLLSVEMAAALSGASGRNRSSVLGDKAFVQPRAERSEPEARFVFSLAGADPEDRAQLDAMPDWTRLLHVAWENGAAGALREFVRRHRQGTVPLETERALACLALERDLRMRTLQLRAADSIAALSSAGIDVALLKGAALATTLYGSFAARPMNDVDVLVDPDQVEEAKRLMLLAGWERDPELPDDRVYAMHHHLAPLIDTSGSRSRLEIHRTLLPPGHPFVLPMADLWAGMRPATIGGHPVLVLGPTHHALHIAIHFAWSHSMRAGGWNAFRDLGTLERAGMIDWAELVRVAQCARAGSCCYWTLRLARTMTGLRVPSNVLAALEPTTDRTLHPRLERHLVTALLRGEARPLSVRLDRALWTMAVQPGAQGHGASRPWLVSAELAPARVRPELGSRADRAARRLGTIARSGACIARLLWN